jgi:predicted amidophosphoribosyltransferase
MAGGSSPGTSRLSYRPRSARPFRGRRRGTTNPGFLAREIARISSDLPSLPALVRRRATPPQVGQPDWEARRENVARAFTPGRRPLDGGVLLIDDVITTGATLDACARVLLGAGAGSVFALTFARED